MICSKMTDRSAIVERQLQLLGRLAEAGLEIAVCVEKEAREGGDDLNACAMDYSRVARSVRLTILLQSRIIQGEQDQDARVQAYEAQARFDHGKGHKGRVERIVGRIAREAFGDDEDTLERLHYEAAERLDEEDIYGDVEDRPLGELVAFICRDLGLDPNWAARAEEAWAKGEPQWPPQICPTPLPGEVAQRAGGGIPPPHPPGQS